MAESTLLGLQGEPNMYECAFVQSDVSGPRRQRQVLGNFQQGCCEQLALALCYRQQLLLQAGKGHEGIHVIALHTECLARQAT
jgi:hypothetical protein